MDTPQSSIAVILREQSSERFRVTVSGKVISLPHAGRLSADLTHRVLKTPSDNRIWYLLEAALDEDDLELLDTLPIDEFNRVVDRWFKHGGIRLGEVLWLLEAIEAHTAAVEFDLRRLGIDGVGEFLSDRYTWRERHNIFWAITQFMDSLTTASLQGWERTWSLEAQVQSDLWNLNLTASSQKKPKASDFYPSPVGRKRIGSKARSITEAQARIARLKKLQPGLEIPRGG